MARIGYAQVSFWFGHAYGMCSAAQQHEHADLVCVFDEDEGRGRAAAERFDVPFVADYGDVLARDDVDAIGLCSPTYLHGEQIEAAAAAGKHCMVEKPFTHTVAQADAAIRAAETHGIQVMPIYNLQFSPSNQTMKQLVDDGALGPLYQVRRRHGQPKYGPFDYDAAAIMADPKSPWGADYAGESRGCIQHCASHAFFWMLWMFGMPDSVVSLSGTNVDGLPVEDNNVSVFSYHGGQLLVTLHSSQTETAAPLTTEIYGRNGSLVQTRGDHPSTRADFGDTGPLMLYLQEEGQWQTLPDIDRAFIPPGYSPPVQFFDALAAGQPMPISMQDGRRCVQLLTAAEIAALEGRRIDMAEVD